MAKPAVDGLERDLHARLSFARVNIGAAGGEKIAHQFRVRAVPTFLLISAEGELLYRQAGGLPDGDAIVRHLPNP